MIYVTADPHFCHKNVIAYENRPFASTDDMNEAIIQRCNEVVTNKDTLLILGDFIFCSDAKKSQDVFNRLRGQKCLIRGNHDRRIERYITGWQFVRDYYEFKYDGQYFVCMHYPLQIWNRSHYGAYHLHGHSHGSCPSPGLRRLDVGVDCHDFRPLAITDIIQRLKAAPSQSKHSHGKRSAHV